MKQRWEYDYYSPAQQINLDKVNEMGQDGWELAGFAMVGLASVLLFKRKIELSASEHFEEVEKMWDEILGDDEC